MKKSVQSPGPAARIKVSTVLACLTAAVGVTALAGQAQAGIAYIGGTGITVYGVAPYAAPAQANPVFIGNNVTGFNDILASPGHGFLLASPVVANNISQVGVAALPLASFQIGGGNAAGAFGAGSTVITGPRVGFQLSDSGPGGGSASYSISSWTSNYVVTAGGFAGNLGTFLSIGGSLPAVGSAGVASLVSDYYLNGAFVGQTTPLVLAAAGNGNFQALGGNGAAIRFVGNTYRGLAIDLVPAALGVGNTITVLSTLTEYADPASIDSFAPDLSLLPGDSLPDFAFSDVGGGVPEPATWAMMLAGMGCLGGGLRARRRKTVEAA
jgi:hypothetical protein